MTFGNLAAKLLRFGEARPFWHACDVPRCLVTGLRMRIDSVFIHCRFIREFQRRTLHLMNGPHIYKSPEIFFRYFLSIDPLNHIPNFRVVEKRVSQTVRYSSATPHLRQCRGADTMEKRHMPGGCISSMLLRSCEGCLREPRMTDSQCSSKKCYKRLHRLHSCKTS